MFRTWPQVRIAQVVRQTIDRRQTPPNPKLLLTLNVSDGSGQIYLRKYGSGTLTPTGNNTYTGSKMLSQRRPVRVGHWAAERQAAKPFRARRWFA
jgi:hypothetical protein